MYCLTEQQIDFILNDISARGVEMESLQQNLLDHICCIIEQHLEEDGNFEGFYRQTIATFYKVELKEIEVETINLLTHKNYYVMKKIMLFSGAFSVAALTIGIFFKFMHLTGAAAFLLLGIASLSFVFLPLMFVLRVKEQQSKSNSVVAGIGTLAAILISIGILFKVMHWPGANVMCMVALGLMLAVFLPIYFFSGIRNPQTKVNTIVSSVLLFAGCALILTLIRSPQGSKKEYVKNTDYFLRNEQIVRAEQRLLADAPLSADGDAISRLCEELKSFLLENETGSNAVATDFEAKGNWIADGNVDDYFAQTPEAEHKLKTLKTHISAYNNKYEGTAGFAPISIRNSVFDDPGRVGSALNDLIQIQMVVLQNQRRLIASR